MKKILVDINIFEDIIRKRKGWRASEELVDSVQAGKIEGWISALTIPIVYFFRLRVCSEKMAREKVKIITSKFRIVSLTKGVLNSAMISEMTEFEDNIQFFSAKKIKADFLITRNKKHYRQKEIATLTPEEFFERQVKDES